MGFFKLQCTTCGGDLVKLDENRYRCESCRLVYERTENASGGKLAEEMNRASYERWNGRFSEALDVYDRILEENPDDFEANWGAFLSEHNIGYIKAPDGTQSAVFYGVKDERIFDNYNYSRAMRNCPSGEEKEFTAVAEVLENTRVKAAKAEKESDCEVLISCVKSVDGADTPEYAEAERIYNALKKRNIKVFCPAIDLKNVHPTFAEPAIYGAIKNAKILIPVAYDEENAKSDEMKSIWRRYPRINEQGKIFLIYDGHADVFPSEIFRRATEKYEKGSAEIVDTVLSLLRPKKEEKPQKAEPSEKVKAKPDNDETVKKTEKREERRFSEEPKRTDNYRVNNNIPPVNAGQYVTARFSEYGAIRTNPEALRQIADSVRRYNLVQDNVINECLSRLSYLVGQWDDRNMEQVIMEMQRAKNQFESKFPETEAFCRWLEEKANILDK